MYFLEGSHYRQPTLKKWYLSSASSGWSISSPHLFTQPFILYWYVLMCIYFVLWVIIQLFYCWNFFNFGCCRKLIQLASVSFWHTSTDFFHTYFSCPCARIRHFSKETACFLLLKKDIRNQALKARWTHHYWVSLFLGSQLTEQEKSVHIPLTCVFTGV